MAGCRCGRQGWCEGCKFIERQEREHKQLDVPAMTWPIPMHERARLALAHEPEASSSPDGFRLATCVVPECKRPMVAMWHLWLDDGGLKKEIHMCHRCATDIYGAPTPGVTKVWPADYTWEPPPVC